MNDTMKRIEEILADKPDKMKRVKEILADKSKPCFPVPLSYMDELEILWDKKWGAQSEIGKLEEVIVCKPGEEMAPPEVELKWYGLRRQIDVEKVIQQFENFVEILKTEGIQVHYLKTPTIRRGPYGLLSRIWGTRDEGIVVNGGAIVSRMSLPFRRGDEVYWARTIMELGCPIIATVRGNGTFEGGNVVWLDPQHVCIGRSIRTNQEGLDQVTTILRSVGVEEIKIVPIPGWFEELEWPAGGFAHLDCVLGYVDDGLAVIYPPGVSFDLIEYLLEKNINLIEAPSDEAKDYACNTLALEPGKILMLSGFQKTRTKLEKEGVDVIEVEMSEYIVSGGGPHCAVGPLIRQPGPKLE